MFFTAQILKIALLVTSLLSLALSSPPPSGSNDDVSMANEEVHMAVYQELMESILLEMPRDQPHSDQSYLDHIERVARIIKKDAGEELEQRYFDAIHDFVLEKAPLESTQSILVDIFQSLGNEELRDEYARFLNAPLKTEEDEVTSRGWLCRIIGIESTFPPDPRQEAAAETMQSITTKIESRWRDDPKMLKGILSKYYSIILSKSRPECFSIMKELTDIVWEEEDLVMRLEELPELLYPAEGVDSHDEL